MLSRSSRALSLLAKQGPHGSANTEKPHPINRALSLFGFSLNRLSHFTKPIDEREQLFRNNFNTYYEAVKNSNRGFRTFRSYIYEGGEHPKRIESIVSEFTAVHISNINPKPEKILDVGSYRGFLAGLMCHYDVTTIDIRRREPVCEHETVVTCDAKQLSLPDNSFDVVMSQLAIAHFGLCRYGDEFDIGADIKAVKEMIRCLKPGGLLIFATLITAAHPSIQFNDCRIYSKDMIDALCSGLDCVDAQYFSLKSWRYISPAELTTESSPAHDIALGAWRKPK